MAGWPAAASAFDSTHFKRVAAWKTVGIASTFIIINMGAEQILLRMKAKQSVATSRRTRHGHRSSSQDRGLGSCGLKHVSCPSLQLVVSHWMGHHLTLSQRNSLFTKKEKKKKTAYWLNFKNSKKNRRSKTNIH
jgi:hypothetical protein